MISFSILPYDASHGYQNHDQLNKTLDALSRLQNLENYVCQVNSEPNELRAIENVTIIKRSAPSYAKWVRDSAWYISKPLVNTIGKKTGYWTISEESIKAEEENQKALIGTIAGKIKLFLQKNINEFDKDSEEYLKKIAENLRSYSSFTEVRDTIQIIDKIIAPKAEIKASDNEPDANINIDIGRSRANAVDSTSQEAPQIIIPRKPAAIQPIHKPQIMSSIQELLEASKINPDEEIDLNIKLTREDLHKLIKANPNIKIRKMNLCDADLSNKKLLDDLSKLKSLKALVLIDCVIPKDFNFSERSPSLTQVNKVYTTVKAVLKAAKENPDAEFDLSHIIIDSDKELAQLVNGKLITKGTTNVKGIKLHNIDFNKKENLKNLEKLTKLTSLTFRSCSVNFEFLKIFKDLQFLKLEIMNINQRDIDNLQNLLKLKELSFSQCIRDRSPVPVFPKLNTLTKLTLDNMDVDEDTLRNLENLEELNISNAKGSVKLDGLYNLKALTLTNAVNDPQNLQNFIKLRNLNLSVRPNTNFDKLLSYAKDLKIASLELSFHQDTKYNAILPLIKQMKHLSHLKIEGRKFKDDFNLLGDLNHLQSIEILMPVDELPKGEKEQKDELSKIEKLLLTNLWFLSTVTRIGNDFRFGYKFQRANPEAERKERG